MATEVAREHDEVVLVVEVEVEVEVPVPVVVEDDVVVVTPDLGVWEAGNEAVDAVE